MPSNIYEAVYIPFMLYKYHGMTNFTITKNQLIKRKKDILIQALLILLITASIISCWLLRTDMEESDLVVTLFFNMTIPYHTLGIFILIAKGLYNKPRLQQIFHQISEFDQKLSQALRYKKPSYKKIVLIRLLMWLVLTITDGMTAVTLQEFGPLSASEYCTYFLLCFMITTGLSLYDCFIMECQKRVKFANNHIKNGFVACIDGMQLSSVGYNLEDIKTELSKLIDVVEDINRHFEVHICIKATNLFIGFLWSAYYIILNSGLTLDVILSIQSKVFAVVWTIVCIADFCIDVRIYQRLLEEVKQSCYTFGDNKTEFTSQINISQELIMSKSLQKQGNKSNYYKQVSFSYLMCFCCSFSFRVSYFFLKTNCVQCTTAKSWDYLCGIIPPYIRYFNLIFGVVFGFK